MFPLLDTARTKGFAWVTRLLIAACVGVFGWEMWLLWHGGAALERFVDAHALVARRIVGSPLAAEQWRTVGTHAFLHGGILHLLGDGADLLQVKLARQHHL